MVVKQKLEESRFFKRKGVIFDITFVFDIIIMDRFGFQQSKIAKLPKKIKYEVG